jgi:hypothetical protein
MFIMSVPIFKLISVRKLYKIITIKISFSNYILIISISYSFGRKFA